ncbi:MAG: hypothetical protein R3Y33_03795 [Clostridia bacterium]
MKKSIILFIATLTIALTLTACSPDISDYVDAVNVVISEQDLGEGVTAKASAKGNILVYTYTYSGIPEGTDLELAGEEIVTSLSSSITSSTYEAIKAECSSVEGIIYEYYTEEGDLITSWTAPTN